MCMKWLQKLLIGLVACLTFGIITPTHDIWNSLQNKDDARQIGPSVEAEDYYFDLAESEEDEKSESLEEVFVVRAQELAYEKFGTKIAPVIASEFDEVIFPKIDEVIRQTVNASNETMKSQLAISDKPAGNYSEKIFNVYDEENRKDLVRFHVRTDKRPQDGYYFNFHYHTADDDYIKHYSIGDIYWSKDTPPKWLT